VPQKQIYYWILLIFGLGLYQLSVSFPHDVYRGSTVIEWVDSSKCNALLPTGFLFNGAQTSSYQASQERGKKIICKSQWIELKGNTIEVDITGHGKDRKRHPLRIEVQREKSKKTVKFVAPTDPDLPQNSWRVKRHTFNNAATGGRIRFVLADSVGPSWMALRNRVSFYDTNKNLSLLQETLRSPVTQNFILVLSAVSILLFWRFVLIRMSGFSWAFYFGLLLVSLGIHLRKDAYFMLDDWILTSNLSQALSATWGSFNAHFMPVYTYLYRLEIWLFGDNYIFYQMVSVAVLAASGLLLARLISLLLPAVKPSVSVGVSSLVAVAYCVSVFHADTVQWVICQAIVLCTHGVLAASYFSLLYLQEKQLRHLGFAIVAMLCAPLAFGQGLIVFPFVVLICLLYCLKLSVDDFSNLRTSLFKLASAIGVMAAVGICFYFAFQSGEGDQVKTAAFQATFREYARFLLTSVFYTGVCGGVGFISFRVPGLYYPWFTDGTYFMDWFMKLNPVGTNAFYSLIGATILFIVLLVALFMGKASERLGIRRNWMLVLSWWLIGFALLVIPLALVGVGRAHYPFYQALAFRYQSSAVVGLIIMFCPMLMFLFNRMAIGSNKTLTATLFGTFFLYSVSQLNIGKDYDGYVRNGFEFKKYVSQLNEWGSKLENLKSETYIAEGTPFAGTYPLSHGNSIYYHSALPPVLNPVEMLTVLNYLSPRKYKRFELNENVAKSVPDDNLHAVLSP